MEHMGLGRERKRIWKFIRIIFLEVFVCTCVPVKYSPPHTWAEYHSLTRVTGAVAIGSLNVYSVGGATHDACKSTLEFRGQAVDIVLTTWGRNVVLYCSLVTKPGHNSIVADTLRRYRDVGRNTWHYKEKTIPKLILLWIKAVTVCDELRRKSLNGL